MKMHSRTIMLDRWPMKMMMMLRWPRPMNFLSCKMMTGETGKRLNIRKLKVPHTHTTWVAQCIEDLICILEFSFSDNQIDHFDNNLPFETFMSKSARLNSECSDPSLQENCIVGQKWRCFFEDGQWRKHKCKFHVSWPFCTILTLFRWCPLHIFQAQLQNHMAAVKRFSSQNKRNCACFTPEGVVYTKLKTKRNHKRGAVRRHKRDAEASADDDEIIRTDMPSKMHFLLRLSRAIDDVRSQVLTDKSKDTPSRRKREAVDHITAVIKEIQSTLERLEQTSAEDTSSANMTEKIGAKCFVQLNGKVNCSDIIYEDEYSWRKSKNQIDLLIQVLKSKIVELKGIKKHLKHNKPSNSGDDNDDSSSEESVEDLSTKEGPTDVSIKAEKGRDLKLNASTTIAGGLLSSTGAEFNSDVDSMAGLTVTATPSLATTTLKTTKAPMLNTSKPGHRTRGNSTAPKGQHNGQRNNTGHHRKTTPEDMDTTISTTHQQTNHRRNSFRHSRHNATTRRSKTSTTAIPTSTLAMTPSSASAEASTATASLDELLRMGPAPEATTSAIDALITYFGSIKDEPSTTTIASTEFTLTTAANTDVDAIPTNEGNHASTTQGLTYRFA